MRVSDRMRLVRLASTAIGVWACAFGIAAAQAPAARGARVLILPFAASVDADAPGGAGSALWLGEATALLLGEGLGDRGLGALPRDERLTAFDRLQLPMTSALTRATMIRVGELIGATELVFGEVKLGDRLNVRMRVIHLEPGRELPEISDEAPLSEIFVLLDRLSARLATSLGRPSAPSSTPPAPLPLEAFESYVKGLVAATPQSQQRFLESAITKAPNDPRILTALWGVYTTLGLHERALATANAVRADSPLARKARFAVALSLIELKRLDGAYKELSALHTAQPSATISNALGVVQLRRNSPPGTTPATTYFQRAAQEARGNTDYLFNLGYAFAVGQNAAAALQWLREAVRFDAADGDAHLVMSSVLASTGRQVEAQRELELARLLGTRLETLDATPSTRIPAGLERLPDDLDLRTASRVDNVLAAPAQQDQRDTAAFHLSHARELVAAGRDREATGELRRAVYLAPYEDEPHLLLGAILVRAGRMSDAIDEFTVAIWCRDSAAARVALGNALLDTGDREGARKQADRAIVLAPTSPEARELMKRIGG